MFHLTAHQAACNDQAAALAGLKLHFPGSAELFSATVIIWHQGHISICKTRQIGFEIIIEKCGPGKNKKKMRSRQVCLSRKEETKQMRQTKISAKWRDGHRIDIAIMEPKPSDFFESNSSRWTQTVFHQESESQVVPALSRTDSWDTSQNCCHTPVQD